MKANDDMKKILLILLFLPLFAYPQAEKRHLSIIVDTIKALNGGIFDVKDSASFEKPVGIGGTLDVSAILTLTNTSQGFLVPRMTAVQRNNIVSPATGLLVFDTDSNSFLFFDSSIWTKIIDGNGGVGDMLKSAYDINNDSIVNNSDSLNGDIDVSQIVGLIIDDSSSVTYNVDTLKALNNTNIQFTDSTIFQEHLQTDKSFTVNLGLTTLKGIDATNSNFALKVQDNVGTKLLEIRNDGLSVFNDIASLGASGANAIFAHKDNMNSTDYALLQNISGSVNVNAKTGQSVFIRIAQNDVIGKFDLTGMEILTRSKIGTLFSTHAAFSHASFFNTTDFCLLHTNGGETILNAKSGQLIRFRINNVDKMTLNDGNFGINETSPSEKLHVNGNAIVENLFSTTARTLLLGAAATTFATTSNVMTITGDGGANTIATITGANSGQYLILIFVDGLVTLTDDNGHGANTLDLSAAFTSVDDTTINLIYDGTSWYEVSRSVN